VTAGPFVGVVGAGRSDPAVDRVAEEVGACIGRSGAVLVCGGLGGVMEAACRGAAATGGITVGILPGEDRRAANRWVTVAIPSGLGEARNALVVRTAEVVVAVGGEYGTLSEIALALKIGRPVVGVGTWTLTRPDGVPDTGMVVADGAEAAVTLALGLAGRH
jgi:uncharacterized protein (TIGR00725 family)